MHYIPRPASRPPILIYTITPKFVLRAEVLEDTHRLRHSNHMTTYQKYFKSASLKLKSSQLAHGRISPKSRIGLSTSGTKITYKRHHVCKHLMCPRDLYYVARDGLRARS